VAVVLFVGGTIGSRLPYWGEAEVLFEADRIAKGYPLFIDPLIGASEQGLPPSRYYVTYPPLLSWAMSTVPAAVRLVLGRLLACAAWFGALGWIVKTARPDCRRNAIAGAVFVGGIWILANFMTVGRPDAIAIALAAFGLTRAITRRGADAVSIVLLVLASWVKPTLIGLPAGAIAADVIVRRRWQTPGLAIATAVVIGLVLDRASGGVLVEHVVRSNAQPLTAASWLENVPGRLPFFLPLVGVAFWHGALRRDDPGIAIGLGALASGTAWTLVALAKTGSAANYWAEPCIAALALLAHANGPYVFGRSGPLNAALTLAVVLYTDVASIPSALTRIGRYRDEALFVAPARERCGASASDVIASDEQGVELALNGRILVPAYQMAWLVHEGRFPAQLWTNDLASPNVRCFVRHGSALAPAPAVAAAVDALFAPIASEHGAELLVRRPGVNAPPQ
jgi:hypothetical protein